MEHKIIKGYLEDGMCWYHKETTPFVVIDNIHSVLDCTVNKLDYINVRYSVFFKDKNGDVFPYMKNITATIFNQSLIPYMRDNKLKEILND
jgi:hypothetical protein